MGGMAVPAGPSYESQRSPENKGSDYDTDGSDRYVIGWNGKKYQVFEAWTGEDRDHTLPPGATVIAYNTDPDFCHALIDTDGDGKPNMLTWNPSPEQFRQWVELGQVSPELVPSNLGSGFDGEDPDAVMTSYDSFDDPATPAITGEREGGTFGTERVVYDHEAMRQFCAEVSEAAAAFEQRCGGVDSLTRVRLEPGQTPQAQKMRDQFNLPTGPITDYFDQHVYDLPKNLEAMCERVRTASTRVKNSDTEMQIDAKKLGEAMDRGAGVGSSTDIAYDDI